MPRQTLCLLIVLGTLCGCSSTPSSGGAAVETVTCQGDGTWPLRYEAREHPQKAATDGYLETLRVYTVVPAPREGKSLVAVIETSEGDIVLRLYHRLAPQHVANLVFLAQHGFYEGGYFHRVIDGFMIQGGCPNTKNDDPADDGSGGAGYSILDELSEREHRRGILSAASIGRPDSSGCQFFIMHGRSPMLDGRYTIYGEVIEGMDVVDAIATAPVGPRPGPRGEEMSVPLEPVRIERVTIEER